MKTPILLLASACLLLPGCVLAIGNSDTSGSSGSTHLRGNGNLISESRSLPPFQRVEVRSSFDVEVRVGDPQLVEVWADSNLIERVHTEVRGDTLVVSMRRGTYTFKSAPRVTIQVPHLQGLSLQGSGDVRVSGLHGPSFEVALAGSGDVRASGEVESLSVALQGSGDLRLDELHARQARVRVAGSGDVDVSASESLDAEIAGSGDIRYRGRPATRSKVSGSGSISSR